MEGRVNTIAAGRTRRYRDHRTRALSPETFMRDVSTAMNADAGMVLS